MKARYRTDEKPFDRVEPIHYVDANTGVVVETILMHRFYDWDCWDPHKQPRFGIVRQYALKEKTA